MVGERSGLPAGSASDRYGSGRYWQRDGRGGECSRRMTSQGKVRSQTMTGVRRQRRQCASWGWRQAHDQAYDQAHEDAEGPAEVNLDASTRKLLCLQLTVATSGRDAAPSVWPKMCGPKCVAHMRLWHYNMVSAPLAWHAIPWRIVGFAHGYCLRPRHMTYVECMAPRH